MLFIVDGTGELDTKLYNRDMNNGFCKRMEKQFNGTYFRGPTTKNWSLNTQNISDDVFECITKKHYASLGKQPLILAGHSRGGSAVIRVSQALKKIGHFVDAMFLFDAVDRTGFWTKSAEYIPNNVRIVYHAMRDAKIANYFEWGAQKADADYRQCQAMGTFARARNCDAEREKMIFYKRLDDAMKFRMRASFGNFEHEGPSIPFGNCGTAPEDKEATAWEPKNGLKFLGSHGAMGGSPIGFQDRAWDDEGRHKFNIIAQADMAAMASVWAFMSEGFDKQKIRLHAQLK